MAESSIGELARVLLVKKCRLRMSVVNRRAGYCTVLYTVHLLLDMESENKNLLSLRERSEIYSLRLRIVDS